MELDLRTLYLKDLSLLGCTLQDEVVFENLVGYVERGEIVPAVARTYPLREIVRAQQDFLAKSFTGKLVLVGERVDGGGEAQLTHGQATSVIASAPASWQSRQRAS